MSRTQILALLALSFGSALPLACSHDFDKFSPAGGAGGSSATGTGGSTGGCKSSAACDDDNPCTTDACDAATGKCTHTPIEGGTVPGYVETPGDCKTEQCVGGQPTSVADNNDVPTNTNPCVTVTCAEMMVVTTPVTAGQPCGTAGFCNASGTCVGCNIPADCPAAGNCMMATCNANVCGSKGSSPGASCAANGGHLCNAAGACVQCLVDGDCQSSGASFICVTGKCKTSCTDGAQDGTETGVDCGGACSPCGNGITCSIDGDCQSGDCQTGTCVAANGATCTTDADCASSACVTTSAGLMCCSSACTSTCMSCLGTLTGQANGDCTFIESGKAAPTGCPVNANAPCSNDGKCNGNGGCEQASNTTTCGTASCAFGEETPAPLCSGGVAGTCVPATPVSCGGFACNGGLCQTTCTADTTTGCVAGDYCSSSGGVETCTAQLATGKTCTFDAECKNGTCLTPDAGAADGGTDGGADGGSQRECN